LDKAIQSLENASKLSNGNKYLQQIALSNLADLALHSGDYELALTNYQKSLELDKADYYSIKGLGIIAQMHDNNYRLAERIFLFIASKTKSPDIYFNLMLLAQLQNDKENELKYARKFSQIASQPIYGNMYNKYLIEIYEGIIKNTQSMLSIAQKELENRNTPQTNSWYVWALYKNNQKEKAIATYKKSVAQKPLEGLELYYMGKMMAAEKKEYNANAYFEAAYKNRFELSPSKRTELESINY
jgi:tetratricopeptide (TPR) repeat protein